MTLFRGSFHCHQMAPSSMIKMPCFSRQWLNLLEFSDYPVISIYAWYPQIYKEIRFLSNHLPAIGQPTPHCTPHHCSNVLAGDPSLLPPPHSGLSPIDEQTPGAIYRIDESSSFSTNFVDEIVDKTFVGFLNKSLICFTTILHYT